MIRADRIQMSLSTMVSLFLLVMAGFGTWQGMTADLGKVRTDGQLTAAQVAINTGKIVELQKLPDRITRLEMIMCATDDPVRRAECQRLRND